MRRRRALLAAAIAFAPLLAPGGAAAQADPSFNLVNRSGRAINEIYVSPVSEPNWGRDLLGENVLPNGRVFPVRIAPAAGCRQDVRVVYADGRPEERRNLDTCVITDLVFGAGAGTGAARPAELRPPQSAPQAADAANPSFNLVNHGRQAMREAYVSSARDTSWGRQRLDRPMVPGAHLPVRLSVGDCLNDIRIVWADGRAEERRQVDTCRLVNMVFQ
jgi:hypothetical protein